MEQFISFKIETPISWTIDIYCLQEKKIKASHVDI